jgi:hypothetical protein
MIRFLVVVFGVLVAVTALPMHAQGGHGGQAGGHGGQAGGHGFNGHRGLRDGHRFFRQPFFAWGAGVGWMDPEQVVVIPQFATTLTVAAPPPDPKFVFPPTPSSPNPSGSHTVIVQRGSQIEVQSFPAAR